MSVDKLLKKAMDRHNKADYREAAKLYKKILADNPRHLDGNYLLGTLYAECGENEKAIFHLSKASLIDPLSPMVQVNLGNTYRNVGLLDQAVVHFKRAMQVAPHMFQAHLGLGSALLEMNGDLDKAAESFHKAALLAPHVPEVHHQLGMLLQRQGKPEEAIRALEKVREKNPFFPRIHAELGLICLQQGNNQAAAEYFREGCRIAPGDAECASFLEAAEGRTAQEGGAQESA